MQFFYGWIVPQNVARLHGRQCNGAKILAETTVRWCSGTKIKKWCTPQWHELKKVAHAQHCILQSWAQVFFPLVSVSSRFFFNRPGWLTSSENEMGKKEVNRGGKSSREKEEGKVGGKRRRGKTAGKDWGKRGESRGGRRWEKGVESNRKLWDGVQQMNVRFPGYRP